MLLFDWIKIKNWSDTHDLNWCIFFVEQVHEHGVHCASADSAQLWLGDQKQFIRRLGHRCGHFARRAPRQEQEVSGPFGGHQGVPAEETDPAGAARQHFPRTACANGYCSRVLVDFFLSNEYCSFFTAFLLMASKSRLISLIFEATRPISFTNDLLQGRTFLFRKMTEMRPPHHKLFLFFQCPKQFFCKSMQQFYQWAWKGLILASFLLIFLI